MTDNPHLIPVRAEFNVFADDMLLAGQVDMLFYDTNEKEFRITDWKRSKKMEFVAFGNRCGKPPFDKLPDTNFGHYACQQTVYALILEEYYGVHVQKLTLLQLHPNYDSSVEHVVPDIRKEVRMMFEDRKAEVRAMKKRKADENVN